MVTRRPVAAATSNRDARASLEAKRRAPPHPETRSRPSRGASAIGTLEVHASSASGGNAARHADCDTGPRGEFMGNATNRGEGVAEQIGGKIKQGIGKATGNEQMEAEGKAKELKGEAREESAKAGERTKGAVEEATGAVKNRVGAVIDNEQMQAEGKARELKGEARQKANR
jgi:uncharacterized protein YjbJ (UPF0337 family)